MAEGEKEHALLYHREKLAIAFSILSLHSDQPIVVAKNLRDCGDLLEFCLVFQEEMMVQENPIELEKTMT